MALKAKHTSKVTLYKQHTNGDSKKMTEKPFDFWQDHAKQFLELAYCTERHETWDQADGRGKRTGSCGDTVELFIKEKDHCIHAIALRVEGCLNTNACANAVAILAEGKTIAEAWEITTEVVIAYLETLQPDHHHCAELAVGAFYKALTDCNTKRRQPWKKIYDKH